MTLVITKTTLLFVILLLSLFIPYYVVNTFAAVDTVAMVNYVILDMTGAHEDRSADIRQHLRNSLVAANILLRTGFFVSLRKYPEKYSKMMQTISEFPYSNDLHTIKVFIESLLICGKNFCLILIKTNIGLLDGIEVYLLQNAKYAQSLFCPKMWCPQIDTENLTVTTISLGIFGWATNFAENIYSQIARDGIPFAALTLGKSANAFRFKRRVTNLTPTDAAKIGDEICNHYKWIKKTSKHINAAFNMVFRFFLLANIFMFAVFLDEWFNPHLGKIVKCLKLTNIIFVCIIFYYANQTAKTGERFREWMRKEKNRKILGLSELNVIMENLSPSSIGFGRGALFIYDSTLIGFASVVAAYYFGIVETRPQHNMMRNETENCYGCCTNSSAFL